MFAICIEASHKKGMGHLFRMLNFTKLLKSKNKEFVFFTNKDLKTENILKANNCIYEVVELNNTQNNWESDLINKYKISYWINDRLNTSEAHSNNILRNNIKLITFDDLGNGAKKSDLNICALLFNQKKIKGKKILQGVDYLILNSEIDLYKKPRTKVDHIIVSLGGSDTHGVTIKILKLLKKLNIKATIHIGPAFQHIQELKEELTKEYELITFTPSLIKLFTNYDLAITGGGITAFEANASGLPCMIVANESHEIANGTYLESINSSKFLGYFTKIKENAFKNINLINLSQMSLNGLNHFKTNATKNIYQEIIKL